MMKDGVRGKVENEEEVAACCCGCLRIKGCFLLAVRSNSFFTKHNKKPNNNDSS
jgi:hypothetical protein